ncbi:hypothetical protein P152DRAFT_282650 [Eremomyces bilateralis CBS 781.70]|uniref:Uncharacterized protein n=1 Tax=Eremomyces bilateralis CBS 781.70 TaxID=1392243 RepID=A0A6G1G9R5_9PEZI|nr:uncharacterized protein P152DRAFT_282650 [Eremomyces bilateralis CBS 781.70]KAF1814650.1 hypothetical protein P152DRAFT_282650 [Eremomyces bilateralis CBS 781.70]
MPPPPLPTIPTESASSSQSNVLGSIRNRRRSSIQPSESGSRPQSQSRSLADSKEIKRRSGKWDIGNMFRRGRSTASSIISIGSRSSRPSSMALESTDAPQLPHIQGTQPLSQNFNLASQQPMPFPTTSGPPGPQQLHGPAIPQQQDTQAFGTAVQFQIPQWQQGSLMHHQPALDPTKQGPQVAYPNNHSGQPPQQSSSTSEAVPPSRRQSTMAMTVSGAAAPKVSDVALWDEPPKTPTGNPHTVAPFGGQGDHGFDTLMPPPKITEVEGIHQLGVLPSPARSTFKRESHGADMPTNDGDMSPSRMRDTTGDSASEAPDQEAGSLDNVRQKLLLESVVRHSQGYIFEGIDVEQLRKVQREADEEREQEKLEEDKKQQKLLNEITTDGSGTNVEAAVPIDGSDTVTPTGPSFPSKEAQAVSSSQPDGGPVEQIVVASASPMLEDDLVTPRATILYESQVQSAGGATKDDSPDRRRISRASTAASWEKDTSSDAISWPSIEKHRELQPSDNESTGAEDSDIEKTIEIEKTEQYQGSRHNEPAPTVGASSEPRSEQKWQEVKGSPSVFSKQVRTGAAGPSIPSEPTPTAAAGDAQIPRLDPAVNISGAGELDGSGMKPTPNVSTIHPDDDHPRDVSGSEPPVSPVRTSFMERDYHPPAPSRERPMSFVHLPRTGGVPQDVITVSPRHGLQAISDSVSEHSPPKHEPPKPSFTSPKRSSQHGPNLATSPPKQHQSPQGPQISTIPILTPPAGRDMGETIPPAGQAHGKPVQGRPNHGVNPPNLQLPAQRSPEDIRRQTFSPPTIDPRQHSSEYRLPGVGPPAPSKSEPLVQKSRFGGQLFKSKSALKTPPAAPPQPVTPQRINPELVSPPSNRQPSYQSTITSDDGQEEEAQKKLRKSGIINPFNNRPLSVDADSVLSKADSTQGQAGDSPTRTISQQIIGGIPPPVEKPKPTDAKSGKKLQRSSSSLGPDPPKKKRFSALGSFFGRSESKMTKKGGPAIIGPGPAYQDMRSYQSNPQRGQSSSSNRTMSLPHSMPPPILEDPGMPPPLGGYYAPPTWSPDQGLGRVDPTGQQQPVAERTQSLTSNTQQHLPYAGPAPIRNSPPVPPGYGPGAVPYGPQSVSSISPDSRASLGPRTPSGGPFFYNANGSPAQGGMPPMDPRQGPAPGNQRWSNAAMPPYIRMGSINETPGQHQERPWNISLPSSVEESEDEMSHNRRPSQEMIAARMAAMRYRRVSDQGHFPPQTYTPAQLAQLTQMQQHQQYQQYQQYQQQQVFIQQQRLMQQQQQQVQQRSYGQPPPAASYQQPPSPQSQASSQPPPPMSFQQTPSPPSQAPPQPQQILQRTQSLPQQPHGFVLPQQPAQHNLPRSLSHAHSSPHTTQPPHSSYSPQPPPAPQQYSSPPEPERTPPQPPSLNTNVKPHRIPLPMSPSTATSMSPINPLAISMSPPPPPPKDFPPGPPHVFQDPAKGNSAALSTTAGVSAAGAVAVGGAAAVTGASAADSQPLREDSEDDEPVMRGVSYPGMEWVPQWTED